MNEVVAMGVILVLAVSGYAAGRLHGQLSYRTGYRYGYRHGYFDGDRSSWNRRRRELQAAVASVLKTAPAGRLDVYQPAVGTTYTTSARGSGQARGEGRHARADWALVDAVRDQ
jgi:hypothetical protein